MNSKYKATLIILQLLIGNFYCFELLEILPDAELQGKGIFYQHPAMVSFVGKKEINLFYSDWYFGTKVSNFNITFPISNIVTAFDYTLLNLEDTYRTTFYETTEKIKFSNNSISLRVGTIITDVLSFGTNLKFVGSEISFPGKSLKDEIIVFDLGAIYTNIPLRQRLGLAIHNFLISGKTDKSYDTISIFGDQKIGRMTFNCGAYLTSLGGNKSKFKMGLGVEHPILKHFEIRVGVKYQDIFLFSTGFSFKYKIFCINYAFLHHLYLGQTHNFSISLNL